MENFNDAKRNQINIAICGPVSAGKSTLLNALFVASYSDMKIKRTTATPQVYFETEKLNKKQSNEIKKRNKEINTMLMEKEQSSLSLEDIKETHYLVPPVKDLVTLEDNVHLTVYDLPGLNDAQTKEVYFQYMDKNFYKFDVILFIVDIHSAMNTSDESDILERILRNAKVNFEKYGIQKKMMVVVNKCDELQFTDGKFSFLDEELEEMYEQVNKIVAERVQNIYPEMDYQIVPMSSEDTYIYRMYDENPDYKLDIKHINKFGYNEYGRSRWNRLSDEKKELKVKQLMEGIDTEETLTHTGFTNFSCRLGGYLNFENQYTFLVNHLRYGLANISNYKDIDISADMELFYHYYQRFNEINSSYSGHQSVNLDVMTEYLNTYLQNYKLHIISQYISFESIQIIHNLDDGSLYSNKVKNKKVKRKKFKNEKSNSTTNIKSEDCLLKVESLKKDFDKYNIQFDFISSELDDICLILTDSLNNFYLQDIKQKKKGVTILFEYLYKLFTHNFKVTKDLVKAIFDNHDMKTKTQEEIINYLESIEEKKLITSQDKIHILSTFIMNIYGASFADEDFPSIPLAKAGGYFFQKDLFYTELLITDRKIFQEHELEVLAYMAKCNLNKRTQSDLGGFASYNENTLYLEKYLVSLLQQPQVQEAEPVATKKSVSTKSKKKTVNKKVSLSDSDSGNLSEEIEMELGIMGTA